ncbi:MAG: VPLPA-CTERM-specific exosortase XrtD [Nitrospira sp. CR1.3]|nr:VPLPA-CTERM-specific exosortase XrtD [Nitrospira sp. CR1.3]
MSIRPFLVCSISLALGLLGFLYFDSLSFLLRQWVGSEDYSHGLFVPFVSGFLMWQSRSRVIAGGVTQPWLGIIVMVGGLVLSWIGELGTIYVVSHVSLWLIVVGLIVTLIGVSGTKAIAFPLLYLLTAIPLPVFLYAALSAQLQLMSSALGVWSLQAVGVTAFREGNVIDLGPVQLQVAEACSGVRYLLPLTSLALLCAYLFKDSMWKRALVVLSSLPISILINGFRIGMIGVLVETYGEGAAEGFYHFFEGWVLFMASLGLLVLEMSLLARIGARGERPSLLGGSSWIETSWPASDLRSPCCPPVSRPVCPAPAFLCGLALLVPFAFASKAVAQREEAPPPRSSFVDFPMQFNRWEGTPLALERQFIDALRLDDYVLADFRSIDGTPVNLYAAYYRSQKMGQSAHSPQSCLPGGGWEISSLSNVWVPSTSRSVWPLQVNRALIQKADQKQIVLYWFKQRDRLLTNEYLVKFYLFWDALSRQRTDGALVRVASLMAPGESETDVDRRLLDFASIVQSELTRYVPD